jgi:hypothetical protein
MRLLSFLSEIEQALLLEANATDSPPWETSRMVNFQAGIARLTLSGGDELGLPQGVIVVQRYWLADNSFCLKAQLQWLGSEAVRTLSVFEVPLLSWKLAASRVATDWLAGPPAEAVPATEPANAFPPLAATG